MSRYPQARWRPVTRYDKGGANHVAMNPSRLVLHTAVSSSTSLFGLFNTPGNAVAHFYVDADGTAEQYVDTDVRSSAVLDGNSTCVTVESWDGYPWPRNVCPAWTPAQVEWLAGLAAWCQKVHGIPLVQLPSSRRGTTGVGWHRQGIDGNFPPGLLGGRVDGGEKWSLSAGKTCPTDNRIRQIPTQILPRAVDIAHGGEPPMKDDEFQRIDDAVGKRLEPIAKALAELREHTLKRDRELAAQLDALTKEK